MAKYNKSKVRVKTIIDGEIQSSVIMTHNKAMSYCKAIHYIHCNAEYTKCKKLSVEFEIIKS